MSQEQIQVPKGWELVTLGSICEPSKYGYTSKSHTEKRGVPLIRITDINEDGTLRDGRVYVDIDDNKLQTYKLQKGDILIARTADVGLSFLYNEDETMIFASYLIRFRPNQKIVIPKFLLYVLKSGLFWRHINIKKTTTAVSNVNAGNLSKFEFCLPPLPIQKKIVQKLDDILGQLEEKKKMVFSIIDQNKEKIDFFEKNWNLFIIDSELKKFPDSQKIILADCIMLRSGNLKQRRKLVKNGKYAVFGGNGIMGYSDEYLLDKQTVVIGRVGANCGEIHKTDSKCWVTDNALYCILKKEIDLDYLYYVLKNLKLNSLAKRSAQPVINQTRILSKQIPLPPIPIQKQVVQNIKNAEEKFKSQKIQFENIKENYDNSITYVNHIQSSILDAAFSGKLIN